MTLLFFLAIVYFYLVVVDIRLAFARLFYSGRRLDAAVERQGVLGSRWILFWGEKLIGLKVRMESPAVTLPEHFVLVANHQSLLDILVILAGFPDNRVRFVSKQELGRFIPGASRTLRYGRHALIDRTHNLRETSKRLKTFAARCGRKGWNPVIFPEGTRSRDGSLGNFHQGAYRFVQDPLMLPTAVVAIDGGSNFSHFRDFLKKNNYSYRIRVVNVLEPAVNKKAVAGVLEAARDDIRRQLQAWQSF